MPVDLQLTFRSIVFVHPLEQIAFDQTTLLHFLAHGDDQVERFEACFL